MFRTLCCAAALLACSAALAQTDPKDDIKAAVQKVTTADNYTWSSSMDGGRFSGTSDGKIQGGLVHVTSSFGDNTMEFYAKGDQAAIKTDDGWKSASEILADADNNGGGGGGGGGFDPNVMAARMATAYKAPADQSLALVDQLQNIQKTADGYTADLTEDGVKQMMTFGRRRRNNANGNGPQFSNLKGNVVLTIADGALTKSVVHVTGTMSFNGNDVDVDRTTTVTFSNVGSTSIDVPADAAAKLSGATSQPAAQ